MNVLTGRGEGNERLGELEIREGNGAGDDEHNVED